MTAQLIDYKTMLGDPQLVTHPAGDKDFIIRLDKPHKIRLIVSETTTTSPHRQSFTKCLVDGNQIKGMTSTQHGDIQVQLSEGDHSLVLGTLMRDDGYHITIYSLDPQR